MDFLRDDALPLLRLFLQEHLRRDGVTQKEISTLTEEYIKKVRPSDEELDENEEKSANLEDIISGFINNSKRKPNKFARAALMWYTSQVLEDKNCDSIGEYFFGSEKKKPQDAEISLVVDGISDFLSKTGNKQTSDLPRNYVGCYVKYRSSMSTPGKILTSYLRISGEQNPTFPVFTESWNEDGNKREIFGFAVFIESALLLIGTLDRSPKIHLSGFADVPTKLTKYKHGLFFVLNPRPRATRTIIRRIEDPPSDEDFIMNRTGYLLDYDDSEKKMLAHLHGEIGHDGFLIPAFGTSAPLGT